MKKSFKVIGSSIIIMLLIVFVIIIAASKLNLFKGINKDVTESNDVVMDTSSEIKEDKKEIVTQGERKTFNEVKNYNIYYGYEFTDEIIDSMGKYDVVVVEPLNIRDDSILKRIKEKGVSVYGYVPFAEVSPYDPVIKSKVQDSDYLLVEGKRIQNFGCDIADIRSDNFKSILMDVVQSRIVDGGYDGIFLDTLDDFEFTSLLKSEALVDEMTSEVAELLKLLNTRFPNLSVILNRAFTGLDKCEGRYVDAVLYESMIVMENDGYFNNIVNKIDRFTAKGGVCLSLSNTTDQELSGIKKSKEKGWIHFYRPDQEYTKWYEYINK